MLMRLRDALLVWRRRGMVFVLAHAATLAGVLLVIPRGQQEVPGRLGIYTFVWPLVPAVAAVFLPLVSMRTSSSQDRVAPAYATRRGLDLAVFSTFAVAAVVWRNDLDVSVLVRNVALFIGLTAVCTRVLGPTAAWVVPAGVVMIMWLLGTGNSGQPYGWAVALHPAGSAPALVVAAVAAAVGVLGYLTEPARD
ncbi:MULTISPECIES: hypothetical protein [Cellulomonas]|uniref:Uncharacterized protein n=1 Tax=Cellulomonas uda TaxID=1714 RepID=A0A4Y3KF33_CELUD|nr:MULTISPECIES: hypothetical protein [Cellulomonas]GEA82627.1 hypothetical protein CUD01_30710 [Cellulomonas uda]